LVWQWHRTNHWTYQKRKIIRMEAAPAPVISPSLQTAYDNQYDTRTQRWRELGARRKAANIGDVCHSLKFDRVLDVGAGEGAVLAQLQQTWGQTKQLHAIEISNSALALLKGRELPALVEAKSFDGYSIPYADQHFDLTILSHVLEHVEFPRRVLRELARVSQYQVIEVPLDYAFNVDAKFQQLTSYGHINLYTPTLLRFLLKSEGFEIIRDKLAPLSAEARWWMKRRDDRQADDAFMPSLRDRWKELRFQLSSRKRQERKAYTYTVLCRQQSSLQIFHD
jgi:ubiquinone/menaquinone biosynthesis C-methylase UbiE